MVMNNLAHRPVRTALSVAAVAVMVVLIISTVGLVTGMMDEMSKRMKGVGADILVQPGNAGFIFGLRSSPMSEKIGAKLKEIPHVAEVAPVLMYSAGGLTLVYGVDDRYRRLSGPFELLQGRDLQQGLEILADDLHAKNNRLKVGQTVNIWNTDFTLVGIVQSGKGARLYVPLTTSQDLNGSVGYVSVFFVKLDDPKNMDTALAAIKELLEGYNVRSMEEYTSLMVSNFPGLQPFIKVMITISVIIGFLVIFLAMYTTVLERTREIGILKSLGASKLYIANLILWETAMVAVLGIAVGTGSAVLLRKVVLQAFPTLTIYITQEWILKAGLIALLASLVGALYPAWRAARQDPIAALAYE